MAQSHAGHGRVICSCGALISQCRCFDHGKTERVERKACPKGISSMQLAKEIGVTQKTAWFILGRLREACSAPDSIDKLKGIIEIDEAFLGGKEANKHERKKLHAGRGAVSKIAVLGMKERGGRVRAKVTPIRSLDNVHGEIHANVEVGSQLYTDDHMVFNDLDGLFFQHDAVNHSAGEYKRGAAHTKNADEG